MKSNKNLGRIIGLLFLIIIATGVPSNMFRGLSSSMARTPEFLQTINIQAVQMRFVILLSFITNLMWVVVVGILYPLLKKFNPRLALAFLVFWTTSFAVALFGDLSHLSLLSLAQEALNSSTHDIEQFQLLGLAKVKDHLWSHFMVLILYSSSTLLFFYYLFKTKLVPRILSAWGMVAMIIVFTASWLNIFDLYVGMYPFFHNGLHMIVFTFWLLIKGFSPNKQLNNIPQP
ncbi:DUF4386 domain-containing protein [uncultured Croceitalea sp.]|uniref:DUF4386 domain-containing protein n=1 Tax=uncultured Croceitalea sp. TaxID=1798908 RepID=UPI00330625E6